MLIWGFQDPLELQCGGGGCGGPGTPSKEQPRSLGFTVLGVIFAYVTFSFNSAVEVVTFRLREWSMLGVFMLPAFIPSRT